MLRPQSGSEHELADPLTSLCCLAPVLKCRHVLCGDQTRSSVGVLGRHSGMVLFYPDCAGSFRRSQPVQADFCFCVSSLVFPQPMVKQEF